jgi:negative regulator of flagellin synthesis FlgM
MSEINNITAATAVGTITPSNAKLRDNEQAEKKDAVASTPSDKVSLTVNATQIQSVQQTVTDAPSVDNDRVAELRAAIADGTYSVDANELAGNLIDFESKIR